MCWAQTKVVTVPYASAQKATPYTRVSWDPVANKTRTRTFFTFAETSNDYIKSTLSNFDISNPNITFRRFSRTLTLSPSDYELQVSYIRALNSPLLSAEQQKICKAAYSFKFNRPASCDDEFKSECWIDSSSNKTYCAKFPTALVPDPPALTDCENFFFVQFLICLVSF